MNWIIGISLAFVWIQGLFWLLAIVLLKKALHMRRTFQNLMTASQGGLFNLPKSRTLRSEEVAEVLGDEEQ